MMADQTARTIARALGETAPHPRGQIARIVQCCGGEQALAWLAAAQQIEGNEGLLTRDGSRRRTPGGVYLYLVRQNLVHAGRHDDLRRIFGRSMIHRQGVDEQVLDRPGSGDTRRPIEPPTLSPPPAPPAPVTWDNRGQIIESARGHVGKGLHVKITIIGRPARTVERQQFTLLMLTHSGPLPSLPHGIPAPAQVPETTYIVYIGAKQWRKVKAALATPDDMLIVEGVPIYDSQYQAIAVFATNTTTKALQQATRTRQQR